ncbi:unnamed protein product [Chironomus riparius]|uniref:Ionotropic receptor n=1 Tax=Chironomus riparius TaxID=315576 RepID=A0A9N9RT63_9DIPT|nr:unnamed protein product [Chironomus riparius]
MFRIFFRLSPLIYVYVQLCDSQINVNSKELLPVQSIVEATQCEKMVNFLNNVFRHNNVFRYKTVNIAIADYSKQLDTSCLTRKLQEQDDRIVIDRFTRIKFRYQTLDPDYFILIEDYTDNAGLVNKPRIKGFNIKSFTKFIFITNFMSDENYEKRQKNRNFLYVVKTFDGRAYIAALILNVINNNLEEYKLFKTISEVDITNADYNLDIELVHRTLNILYYDTPPYSYRSNDSNIIGVEGNFIDEFCSRYNFSYKLSNKQSDDMNILSMFDISLSRRHGSSSSFNSYVNIEFLDKGTSQCFLVPRNIPVFSHLVPNPFDKFVNFLFLTSILMTVLIWKGIRILQKENMKFFKLAIMLSKLMVGYPVNDRELYKWSLKEKFLLIPFIMICFILMDIFKSFVISTSIVEQPMRSIQSLEELSSSDTKLYEYYKEVDLFPHNKVLNQIPIVSASSALSILPEHVDRDLAYVVRCKFAEVFIDSENNFDGNQQLFDVFDKNIEKTNGNYLIHEGVPYKNVFFKFIDSLIESGILNHWITITVKKSFPKHVERDKQFRVALEALYLPLIILGVGIIDKQSKKVMASKFRLKKSTKLIFITQFKQMDKYIKSQKQQNLRQVYSIYSNSAIVNALLIDVFENGIKFIKYSSTFTKFIFKEANYSLKSELIDSVFKVVYYDTHPYSYRSNDNRIIGVEGNVLNNFCIRNNLTYRITNDAFAPFNQQSFFEISLNRRFSYINDYFFDYIHINDFGASQCLLVPRNIPTYSHIISIPYDKYVLLILSISFLIIGILWKSFRIVHKQNTGILCLTVSLFKIMIGYSIDDREINKWSFGERLLLIPFLIICFILMDIFKSFIISTSIIEQPMRSITSIEELISSNTMIYEYYKEIPLFPENKVLNHVPMLVGSSALSKLPEHVNHDLAYAVRCKFAEEFVTSDKNFHKNRQIFDVFDGYVDKSYSSYLIHENYPLKHEFKSFMNSLQESGILDYWTKLTTRETFPKQHFRNEQKNVIILEALYLPLLILCTGIILAIIIFVMEISFDKFRNWKLSRVIDLQK